MALQVETTTNIKNLADALRATANLQNVTENVHQKLQHLLYRSMPLSQSLVDEILETHRRMPAKDRLWTDFFLEALSDFFLTRKGDQVYLTDTAEERLFEAAGDENPITDPGFRHLLLRLLLRATKVSNRFQRQVLDMVQHHLMHDEQRLLIDLPRQPGTIDIVDLQLIRKLVYGAGGQYDRPIDQSTVNFLIELDQPSFTVIDQEAWRRFFRKAMSLHLVDF